jgi:uncharacterized protein YxeA
MVKLEVSKNLNIIILISLLVIIIGFIFFQTNLEHLYSKYFLKKKSSQLENDLKKVDNENVINSCSSSGSCVYNVNGKDRKLLPVLDPMFNLREICKQIILLEDHLFQKGKRCKDCISKHFLYLEGLAEEAITLDNKMDYVKLLENLPDEFRILQKEYLKNIDPFIIAQKLRTVRKKYMENSFKFGENC